MKKALMKAKMVGFILVMAAAAAMINHVIGRPEKEPLKNPPPD